MSQRTVYLNGSLVPFSTATLSIADPGFLHGASVFTTLRAHRGVVFHFERHLERLAETIRLLGMKTDATTGQLITGMYRVLDADELSEARCRITLTPGPPDGPPTTLITAEPLPDYPADWYEKGIGVIVTALKQAVGDPTFGYKTGCYLPRILARQEAAAKGAEDALWFTTDNRLAESCFSNVFLVRDGEVFTPPRDTPVLPGVVRDAVLELCPTLEIPARDDKALTVDDMLSADEIFLTSSCMGVRPVVRIEKHVVGDETPGPITKKILAAYNELLEKECEKRQSVGTGD
ncbi:MAG: aminotransferase class IV family protein [Phycisphaerae bacterium]|nr:aminotransferase class IV family protein [Phycisphaerae bacterium]